MKDKLSVSCIPGLIGRKLNFTNNFGGIYKRKTLFYEWANPREAALKGA